MPAEISRERALDAAWSRGLLSYKLKQYQQGEDFIAAVEAEGGTELLGRAWRGPEWLPTLEEIREPRDWIARVSAHETAPR